CTFVQLRFSSSIAAARYGFRGSLGLCCTTYRITRKHPLASQSAKGFHHQKGVFIMTNLSNAALKEPDPTGVAEGVYVASFEDLRMTDVESVGGKNASLGEMISQLATAGVRVPGGFATTAEAFRDFLRHSPD